MKLSFPKAEEDGKLMVADENTYTILLAKRKQPYVYNGLDIKREVLMKFKIGEGSYLNQCLILGKNTFGKNFKVIIKSSKDSDYKTLVDALDEVVINKIDSYALLDISKVEEAFLKNRYPTLQ